ncbi:MAG: PAS domain-containing protein [Pirellulaceae bacterium]
MWQEAGAAFRPNQVAVLPNLPGAGKGGTSESAGRGQAGWQTNEHGSDPGDILSTAGLNWGDTECKEHLRTFDGQESNRVFTRDISERKAAEKQLAHFSAIMPFVHPDDVSTCHAFIERVLSTDGPQPSIEFRVRHKNGEWRWYRTSGSCGRDGHGQPNCVVGMGESIDERKKAEAQLQQRLDELQTICSGIVEGLLITDIDTQQIQRVNTSPMFR